MEAPVDSGDAKMTTKRANSVDVEQTFSRSVDDSNKEVCKKGEERFGDVKTEKTITSAFPITTSSSFLEAQQSETMPSPCEFFESLNVGSNTIAPSQLDYTRDTFCREFSSFGGKSLISTSIDAHSEKSSTDNDYCGFKAQQCFSLNAEYGTVLKETLPFAAGYIGGYEMEHLTEKQSDESDQGFGVAPPRPTSSSNHSEDVFVTAAERRSSFFGDVFRSSRSRPPAITKLDATVNSSSSAAIQSWNEVQSAAAGSGGSFVADRARRYERLTLKSSADAIARAHSHDESRSLTRTSVPDDVKLGHYDDSAVVQRSRVIEPGHDIFGSKWPDLVISGQEGAVGSRPDILARQIAVSELSPMRSFEGESEGETAMSVKSFDDDHDEGVVTREWNETEIKNEGVWVSRRATQHENITAGIWPDPNFYASTSATPMKIGNIQKMKAFFGETTPRIMEAKAGLRSASTEPATADWSSTTEGSTDSTDGKKDCGESCGGSKSSSDLLGSGQRSLIGFDPSSWTLERMARGKKAVTALAMRSMTHVSSSAGGSQSPSRGKKSSTDRDQSVSPKSKEAPQLLQQQQLQQLHRTWKGKVANTFRRYGSSPATTALDSPGSSNSAAEEPRPLGTFGVPLEACHPSSTNEYVPLIVEMCTHAVEERGLENQGIYRVPGNTGAINLLIEELNKDAESLCADSERWADVNLVSSLLKLFFRKLPDSLITDELYESVIAANRIENSERRMLKLKKLIHELPEHNYETLQHLARHLATVAAGEKINKMDARNLSIVFGPTLIRPQDESMLIGVKDVTDQCRVVETIIQHWAWFFSSWDEDVNVPIDEDAEEGAPVSSGMNQQLLAKAQSLANREVRYRALISNFLHAANQRVKLGRKKLKNSSSTLSSTDEILSTPSDSFFIAAKKSKTNVGQYAMTTITRENGCDKNHNRTEDCALCNKLHKNRCINRTLTEHQCNDEDVFLHSINDKCQDITRGQDPNHLEECGRALFEKVDGKRVTQSSLRRLNSSIFSSRGVGGVGEKARIGVVAKKRSSTARRFSSVDFHSRSASRIAEMSYCLDQNSAVILGSPLVGKSLPDQR